MHTRSFTFIIRSKKFRVLLTNSARLQFKLEFSFRKSVGRSAFARELPSLLMDTWPKNWPFLKGIRPHTERSVYIFLALAQDPCQITSMHKKRKCVRAPTGVSRLTFIARAHKDSQILSLAISQQLSFHIFFSSGGYVPTQVHDHLEQSCVELPDTFHSDFSPLYFLQM